MLIGGITIVGVAASTQLSFSFLLGELVPMKWRFLGNAYLYVYAIPFSGLAPVIAQSLASRGQSGWRWCFYIMIIINALSLVSYIVFYHPPTFDMINKRQSRKAMIKNFDYVGTVLFTGGMVVFLLGLSWGGNLHPWSSPAVIAPIVIGAVALIVFGFYEAYMPIKEPLVPMKLFLNTDWTASTLLLSIGASIYYAFSIVWPQMAAGVYGVSGTRLGWISSIVPGCILLGQIVGGVLAKWIGHTRYQTMFVISVGGALLAAVAAAKTDSMGLVMGLLIVGCFFIGWNESVTLVFAGMCITDQKEIGTAVGLAGSVRSAISTFATTIYTVVLSNRMTSTITSIVVPAVVEAGVSEEDIAALLALLGAGGDVSVIPGVDAAVAEVLRDAYKEAALQAFKTVFLTSLAFTGVGFIVSWWAPNVKSLMTDHVAVLVMKKKKGEEGDVVGETKQAV
ncbi:fungal trichothecene efflux pump [Coniochaeta sp. 2T2.1]|nr:fungal trichothecene efflux pump [Coniochaeta sp. 2T2.1]